ncbi:MAG: hypothetical protein V3W34_04580 [Phycisphaerae bacterium]
MQASEIEKQLHQRPFVPFWLCMSDGAAYEVRHPEMVLVSRTIIALAIHKPRARRPEAIVFCDPTHIIRIEPAVDGRPKAGRPSNR